MKIVQVNIKNFRGIKEGKILLPDHGVLVGDNNVGKSTVLEAIDLVLSPDRLRRRPVVDEHDFFAGDYLDEDGEPIKIEIEVIVADLNEKISKDFFMSKLNSGILTITDFCTILHKILHLNQLIETEFYQPFMWFLKECMTKKKMILLAKPISNLQRMKKTKTKT